MTAGAWTPGGDATSTLRAARAARLRACTLLLVDDEPANLDLLEALLLSAGYERLVRTSDAREVLPLVRRHAPDLVLLDLNMPHRHGLELLTDLQAATPAGEYRPVLVLTADVTWEAREQALSRGARDFVTKPFDTTEVLLRVENLLEARVLHADEAAARACAELATRERERLLAVVAHDLRNPLAVVAMYAETLLLRGIGDAGAASHDVAGGAPEAPATSPAAAEPWGRQALATIHANTLAMQRLVEDLLDASSMRGAGLRIVRVRQRVGDAFERAERMLAPLAESAGVTLVMRAGPGTDGAEGMLDHDRVAQLLSNLVGNAVKFTPAGGRVTVDYALRAGALHVAVIDSGPGIAPEDIPHLFTAFWTGERRTGRRDAHGAGLGLWIARAIVEAHGGTLQVESEPGAGATFRVALPLEGPADS